MTTRSVKVNRAAVLTLWAAVVAKRLGFKWDEALTLGQAIAGMSAYANGASLGPHRAVPEDPGGGAYGECGAHLG